MKKLVKIVQTIKSVKKYMKSNSNCSIFIVEDYWFENNVVDWRKKMETKYYIFTGKHDQFPGQLLIYQKWLKYE